MATPTPPPDWTRLDASSAARTPPPAVPRPPRRGIAWPVVVAGLLLLALVGLTVRAWWRQRDAGADAARGPSGPSEMAVVTAEVEGLPDRPPVLVGDTLVVRVRYAGGCEDHDIALDRETRGDTLVLTLDHDTNGDDCTDEVYDELRLPVGAAHSGPVVLVDPASGLRLPVGRARR